MNLAHKPLQARPLLIVLMTMLAAALAACTGVEPPPGSTTSSTALPSSPFDPTTTAPPAPSGPRLAYRSADEIGVVDGTTVVASVAGTFPPSNDLITTEDYRFVFARTADNTLTTLDVSTGESNTLPVNVGSAVGTGGGSTVVWWEQPNRLMQLDLADPDAQPALAQIVDL
ncbi:MAG: hypothetical protein KAH46_19135, partial [Mycobacterium sp.]|nr:hypothetical protein [Mycobacterium sp.]